MLKKTDALIIIGSKPIHKISDEAYKRKIIWIELSYKDKQQSLTTCEYCKEEVQVVQSLKQHLL